MTTITSPPATSNSVTVTFPSWWIFNPLIPSTALAVNVLAPFAPTQTEMVGAYRLLGRRNPVTVTDAVGGHDNQIQVAVLTPTDYVNLQHLVNSQQTLCLQSAFGYQYYIYPALPAMSRTSQVGSRQPALQFSSSAQPYYEFTFSYVEVDRPPV